MRVVGTFEDRTEWLQARRRGIGASDIAQIIGLSPYGTPWQVYVDKIGATPLDDSDGRNESMRWGQLLEELILDEWEETSGLLARQRGLLVRHATHDWAMASLDALAFENLHGDDPADAIAVVEAKTTGDWSWSDEIPLHYRAQAQWQMLVSGLDSTIFAVLHNGRRFATYELVADYDDQAALLKAAEEFWFGHVLAEKAPAVSAEDNRALAIVYPTHRDEEIAVDRDSVAALVEVKAQQAELQKLRDQLEAEIKATLGEARIGVVDGEKAVSWSTQTAHRIDTKRLRSEQPEIAEKFTYESTSRVLRTHAKPEELRRF